MVSELEKRIRKLNRKNLSLTESARNVSLRLKIPYNTAYAYLFSKRAGYTNAESRRKYSRRKTKSQTPFENSIEIKNPKEFLSIPDDKDYFAESEQTEYIQFCIQQLSPTSKEIILQRFFDRLFVTQIANSKRITYQAVEQQEKKALKKLKKIWEEYR